MIRITTTTMPPINADTTIAVFFDAFSVASSNLPVASPNLFQIFSSCSFSNSSNVTALSSTTKVVVVSAVVSVVGLVGVVVVAALSSSLDGQDSFMVSIVMNPSYVIAPRSTRP